MLHKLLKRLIQPSAGVILSLFALPAMAADVTINLGWELPQDSYLGIFGVKFKELTEEYSDGSVEVKLRCCGQIGSEETAFSAMQLGTVDAFLVSYNNLSSNYPLIDVFALPYIFRSPEHMTAVLDGPVGKEFADGLHESTGVNLLAYGGVFFRENFSVNQPVDDIGQMAGLKFRVPQNRVMIDTAAAFGAQPVALAWSEVPTALQTGAIDASDNGLVTIRDMKFYEFAEHLIRLDAIASFIPLFMSDRTMGKLDDTQKEAVKRAAAEASAYQAEIIQSGEDAVRTWLRDEGGMTLHSPNKAPFIEKAMTVQDNFAAESGEEFKALIEKIRAVEG